MVFSKSVAVADDDDDDDASFVTSVKLLYGWLEKGYVQLFTSMEICSWIVLLFHQLMPLDCL